MPRRDLLLESCEDRILCSAAPVVTINAPPNPKIGDKIPVTVTFSNATGTNPGYGPYVDLVLQHATGTTGTGGGVDFVVGSDTATYLGQNVTVTKLTFQAADAAHPLGPWAIHPYAVDSSGNPEVVYAPAGYGVGDTLLVLQLPFGSFTPTQPAATINLDLTVSNLTELNRGLNISARGGFEFGNDALNNPTTDPSIVGNYQQATILPQLMTITQTYLGPEQETATGPDFLQQYRIDVDVADGQTVTNLNILDTLANNEQFNGIVSTLDHNGNNVATTTISSPSTTTPGGTLDVQFASVTGVAGGPDASVIFSFYVPRIDNGGAVIVPANSGAPNTATDTASAQANWTPIDPGDPATLAKTPTVTNTIIVKSIATQESVVDLSNGTSANAIPGDVLEYTVQVQVSDYFALQNLDLSDIISDGQRIDTTFTPTISWTEQGSSFSQTMLASDYTITPHYSSGDLSATDGTDGTTGIVFNISGEIARPPGQDGTLLGGGVPASGTSSPENNPPLTPGGPATVTITFRTVIQNSFTDNAPSGDARLDGGDTLTSTVTASGAVLNVADAKTPTGSTTTDNSGASIAIANGTVSKTIYAIDGNTNLSSFMDSSGKVQIKPGDTVTYELEYQIPDGSVENLILTDYLPLPIYDATTITTYDSSRGTAAPAAGSWKIGPDDTLGAVNNITPTITTDAAGNSISFNYGTTDNPVNTAKTAEILFTVTVGSQPFADGLFLTNQLQASENNTQQPTTKVTSNAIVQVQLDEPDFLAIYKGVVATSQGGGKTLGGLTFNAVTGNGFTGTLVGTANAAAIGASDDLSGTDDAGDDIRYAVVLQNTGRGNAYDVSFSDTVPSGDVSNYADASAFTTGTNFRVYTGAGTLLTLGTDYTVAWNNVSKTFSVSLTNEANGGISRGYNANTDTNVTDGSNSVVVLYDLTLATTAQAGQTITNTATFTNYSNKAGGTNFIPDDLTDTAAVSVKEPTLTKTLTTTSVTDAGNNAANQATIGELATYTLTLTVPEGTTSDASIVDTMDPGLAFSSVTGVTYSSGVTSTLTPGLGSTPTNVTISGNTLTFNFGTITDTDTNNSVPETITITYQAQVRNENSDSAHTTGNQAGVTLSNAATFDGQYTNSPTGTATNYSVNQTSATTPLKIVEPALTVTTGASTSSTGPFTSSVTGVDAGDTVYYQVTIKNASSAPTAYNATLSDVLPTLTNATIFSASGGGLTTGSFAISGTSLNFSSATGVDIAGGTTITVIVSGQIPAGTNASSLLTNTANIQWTSLPGVDPNERTGAGGVGTDAAVLNNYAAKATASFTENAPTIKKVFGGGMISGVDGSVSTTAFPNVVVGESAIFDIVVTLPEGVTPSLIVQDLIPVGMRLDTTFNGGLGYQIITSASADDVLGADFSDPTALSAATLTAIGGGTLGKDGVGAQISFGNVTVSADNVTNNNSFVIRVRGIVDDIATNRGGQTLDNVGQLLYGTSGTLVKDGGPASNHTVTVVEPVLTVADTVNNAADAGDPLTYTITISNSSQAEAYDVTLSDVLPAVLDGATIAGVTGAPIGDFQISGGTLQSSTPFNVPVGSTVVLTLNGTLDVSVQSGQSISNTTQVFWTSTPGSNPDERTGAGNPNPTSGTLNNSILDNYAISSTAVTTTVSSPTVVKTVANTSLGGLDGDVTPGEIVTYQIAVTLPEGTTNGLVITDALPTGMAYVPGSLALNTTGFGGTVSTIADSPATGSTYLDGTDIKFTFGTITVTGDNNPNNNTFSFTYQAVVDDVSSNKGLAPTQTVLANSTSYVTNVITTPQSQAAADVTVVEPNLSLNHTLTTASTADAGDPFTDTLTIAHTTSSTSEAYDLVLDEPLATDLNATSFTAFIGGTDVSSMFQLVTIGGVQHLQTVSSTGFNLALGQTLTITTVGTLQNSVTPNETITNNATLGYSDYPGDRSPTGGFDPNPTVTTDHERLYNTGGSASITTSGVSVNKSVVTTSLNGNDGLVTPGEIVTYQVSVTVPEGTTPNLAITDALPNGMAYVPGSVTVVPGSFNGVISAPIVTPSGSPTYQDGTDMVFNFSSITSPGDNITTNNTFSFTYQAVVLDTAENTGTQGAQTTLTNSTTFTVNGSASQNGTGSPSVTVVEPRLGVSETLTYDSGHTTGDAGDAVTATMVVSHQSVSEETAYGVTFDDPFSPDLTVSSFTVVDSNGNNLSSDFQLVSILGVQHLQTIPGANIDLAQGVSLTVTAHGTIASTATPNETITNSPAITYSSYPGDRTVTGGFDPDPDVTTDHERFYSAGTSQSLTTAEGSITKSLFSTSLAGTTGSNVAIGEQVTYAVAVTLPEGTIPNLTVTDLLPAGLQYISSSVDTSNFAGTLNTPLITNIGNNVTYSFGTATVNADNNTANNSFTIYVTAQVMDVPGNNGLNTAPGSQTTLSNQASLAITGEPTSTTLPVSVTVVQPQLTVTKTALDTKPDIGETETYTLTIQNTGAASTETAYQVNIGDVIPVGMTFIPGSVNVSAPGDATITNTSTASQLLVQLSQLDLNATATITYEATVNAVVTPGSVISNTVGVNYNSLPPSPGGRTGSTSATTPVTVNAATLSGKIYVDANGNGKFDAGETGLSGVAVQLTGTDITGNAVSLNTTTDANGNYTFINLAAGTYTITEVTQPSGYLDGVETVGTPFDGSANNAVGSDTITNVVIPTHSTTAGVGYNFGELQGSSLAGSVYVDANNNGTRDGGETGIAGVQVQLTGTDAFGQAVSFTTTTDSSGNYIFNGAGGLGLRPGTYTITEVAQPPGYLDGKDTAGTSGGNATAVNDQISSINLATNTPATKYNFGELLPGTISGVVYEDDNNNGVVDAGESGISGVKVTLTGTDDLGDAVNLNATTNAAGLYSFTNLRPGTYTITETQPSAYLDGKDTLGSPGGGTASNDVFTGVTIVSGSADANYNFGELKPSNVSGFVYNDVNNNGAMDAGESGIAGVTVNLTGTDDLGDSVNLTAMTQADGSFGFANLRPGTYTVSEIQPSGYLEGKDTTGSLGGSTVTTDSIGSFNLPSNTSATNYRFGELLPSGLSGTAYIDANDNGVLDSGETRQGGVTITLTGTDDLGHPVNFSTTTAADGTYAFTNLRPGTYTLTETQPAGLLDGLEHVGSLGGTANTAPDSDTISGITLGQNNSGTGYDFADLRPSSLAGAVYVDTNNNGIQDAGETGIGGVAVTLTGTDDRGNSVNVSMNTQPDGTYNFTNLRPGNYTITEIQPSSYLDGKDTIGTPGGTAGNDVFSNIVVTEGTTGTQNNFGELKSSSLAGFVYEDTNNNGVKEAGENGIPGVTVTLSGTDDLGDLVNLTATTDSTGAYVFAGLRPGDYQITETQPAAYLDGKDTVGTPGGVVTGGVNGDTISNVVLNSNTNGANNNFGELAPSVLSGQVYVDQNLNGVPDAGEPGITNTQITLTGIDDRGNSVDITTLTGADGTYTFGNLRPGQYTLTETQPAGYLDGKDAAGPNGGTVGNDVISSITLNSHTTASGYDFGEEQPSSLSGYVYHDANNDGVRGPGETGIPGVTITLTGTDFQGNTVDLSTTTLPNGSYTFGNLSPGTYTITETPPSGYLDGTDTIGTPGGTTGDKTFSNIVLNENVNGTENDFGELIAATASGRVYSDLNDNGIVDGGETGIGGVTITLTCTDDTGSVEMTTTTAADGTYSFGNLRPGTYTLTESQPAGYLDGQETAGTAGGTVDNTTDSNVIQNFTLASNQATTGNNFGELIPSSLSGQVFSDLNNNGQLDGSETGIGNVAITLTGGDDRGNAVNLTTTTAADGTYSFSNLRPGAYSITETQPTGYLEGFDTVGTQGGSGTVQDVISSVFVTSGTKGTGNNFAELLPSTISGSVYVDSNESGVQDGVEPGIGGVTIQLTGTDDLGNTVSQTTTTAGDGTYSFGDLRPGTYAVTETQPVGYLDGKDTVGPDGGNNTVDNIISAVAIAPNTNAGGNTFGELRPSTISGTVFIDNNNDGIQNGTDPGHGGVTLTLTGTDDLGQNVTLVTTTAADGTYSFGNLRPGTYTLTETQPAGLLDGKDTLGTQGGTPSNDSFTFKIGENTDGTGNNFAELQPAIISGSVYADSNNNGVRDPKEPGIPNVQITLTGTDDLGNSVTLTTTTDKNGDYAFSNLRPGTYTISEKQPGGYSEGKDTAGPLGGDVTVKDIISGVTIGSGDIAVENLFGEHPIPPVVNAAVPLLVVDKKSEPTPTPGLFFAFDSFNDFALEPQANSPVLPTVGPIDIWGPALLPLEPIYSGEADPGATLRVDVYGANGDLLASQSVMADAGGNWLVNFGDVQMRDVPREVIVVQTNAPYSFGAAAGRNLRTYYAPSAINPGEFLEPIHDAEISDDPAPLLGGLDLNNPIQLGNVKYGAELLPSEGVASGN
ncbi:MAG TPA: SdrD B-like domain-containing protein [Chthoniobacter sp.]|jgi:fimbrial isopeptide formation D2 family protein/uncharacterized repeat protein (TIGR01451 family)